MKWKIISILIFLFLLANFCWNGEPLYKTLLKTDISKSTEEIVNSAKEEVKDSIDKAKSGLKDASEKVSDSGMEEKKEKVIEISKKAAKEADDLTEKDKKGMQELLKKKLK